LKLLFDNPAAAAVSPSARAALRQVASGIITARACSRRKAHAHRAHLQRFWPPAESACSSAARSRWPCRRRPLSPCSPLISDRPLKRPNLRLALLMREEGWQTKRTACHAEWPHAIARAAPAHR
jgi:hypothetical protein